MDRGAWWSTVHGLAKNRTGLKQFSTHRESHTFSVLWVLCQRKNTTSIWFLPKTQGMKFEHGVWQGKWNLNTRYSPKDSTLLCSPSSPPLGIFFAEYFGALPTVAWLGHHCFSKIHSCALLNNRPAYPSSLIYESRRTGHFPLFFLPLPHQLSDRGSFFSPM